MLIRTYLLEVIRQKPNYKNKFNVSIVRVLKFLCEFIVLHEVMHLIKEAF